MRVILRLPPRTTPVTHAAFPALSRENHRIALVDGSARYSYRQVHARIDQLAAGLVGENKDLGEERIGILLPAGLEYVTALLGIWRAGGIAVPLNAASAKRELRHCLGSGGVTRMVAGVEHPHALRRLCERLGIPVLSFEAVLAAQPGELPAIDGARRAMIVFTSGTTSKPKGVVWTHDAIHGQIRMLVDAWRWNETDAIPLFLPLHHLHGIVNVLGCALWCGATVHAMPKLDLAGLCAQVAAGAYTVFMAVPTVYVKLMDYLEELEPDSRKPVCEGFGRMRLNVSGSAACPARVFVRWQELTGQTLLERYGMTEIGMAISNPYRGERRAGFVGRELPGVTVQLFGQHDNTIREEGTPGEIRVLGGPMFREYWGSPAATAESFRDGWFCTGDVAVVEDGYYRIMGRSSVDIIKSGGYKLSALEIEEVLVAHDDIREAAVVGAPDDTWGESVAAFVSLREPATLDLAGLKAWCAERMSAYKIPRRLRILDELPRNPMGKVIKTALRDLL